MQFHLKNIGYNQHVNILVGLILMTGNKKSTEKILLICRAAIDMSPKIRTT